MNTVFVFILGFILLHEKVFLSDIFGAALIIGFQLYNFYYPPGRQINLDIIENNKTSSINNQNQNNSNDGKL